MNPKHRAWDREEIAEVARLRLEGASKREIAASVGRTEDAVINILVRYGLSGPAWRETAEALVGQITVM